MSAIQEIASNIEFFSARLKQAKEEKRYTNQMLADESGVSLSAVARLLSGATGDPKLYDVVAICRALGLSLDDLFGLERPEAPPSELLARVHAAELDAVKLETENRMLQERTKTQRTMMFVLGCMTLVLSSALVVYLLLDLSIREEGFILWGSPTAYAWAVIFMIAAAVVAVGIAVFRAFWQNEREK